MAEAPVRVLVVDDSAFARKVLRETLSARAGVEVVGIARDGLEALEKIGELSPDVVTLDLVMPQLDGLGVLHALRDRSDGPRVVVVSTMDVDSDRVLAALEAGAVDFVHKPTALATERLYELGDEVGTKVLAAAGARRPPSVRFAGGHVAPPAPAPTSWRRAPLVVIGTSTGGPQALTLLTEALPGDFPSPIAIALHIPAGYTEALARRLDGSSALEVVEAREGTSLRAGRAVLAMAGRHLKFVGAGDAGVVALDLSPFDTPHRPSVDVLFTSAAAAWGSDVLAVVLTGMGNDGLEGCRAVKRAGGRVITEHPSSAVVYGMPRVVQEEGLSDAQVPLEAMAAAMGAWVKGPGRDGR